MNSRHCVLMVVVAVVAFCGRVMGDCDHNTIRTIVKNWNAKIPNDVLKRTVGDLTYVYMSPSILTKDDVRVYCLATRLAKDKTTATDIYVYRDLDTTFSITYKKVENSGKITMKANGGLDESQYVISFKKHVMAFWQCIKEDKTGKFDSLVGIAVDVNHVRDAQAEILEAKKTLKFLGLNTGKDLTPCTAEILQRINKN